MELFKKQTKMDFMGIRRFTGALSLLMVVLSLGIVAVKGLNFGLDFTGGTTAEVRFNQAVDPENVREHLEAKGLEDVRVQHYGSVEEILIRINNSNLEDEETIRNQIQSTFANAEVRRVEFVGAEVGEELAEQGGMAVLVAIIATMIYIALRFEYRFAVSAAVALTHDAILVLGIFALFQVEFDLATLAAVLAVMGYSLNDTIVVFDRVRENFRKVRKLTVSEIINLSINQTLSRTIMTSWLTLLVVLALLFFGGSSLHGFSLALFLGIVIGTYSSIYVAGSLALDMGLSRADMLPRPKADADGMP